MSHMYMSHVTGIRGGKRALLRYRALQSPCDMPCPEMTCKLVAVDENNSSKTSLVLC